jgi:preprotein translocase subunit SecY
MNAQEVLTYVGAAAIVVLTFFFAWLMWVIIAMLRDARAMLSDIRSMMERVRGGIESVEELLHSITERVSQSGAVFTLLAKAIEKISGTVRKKKRSSAPTDDEV